jgi:sugar lactone lactonase YvrE
MRSLLVRVFLGVFGCGLFLLAGCGSSGSNPPAQSTPTTPLSDADIYGTVYGDQQVVSGAHIYLFAANTTGYGNASVSLLSAAETGASDSVGAYVATSTNGTFTLKGDYSCSSGQQLYLYILGGIVNLASNPASGLMAAIGNCPSSSGSGIPLIVNEATTVAAAYAMSGFATDATHVSSSGTTLAKTGVANAFANAANLVTLSTGVVPLTTQMGNGTVPQSEINTLADVLAGCVGSSASCSALFSTATSNGTPTGTVPTDTATAAINIAHNPGDNVAALYAMETATVFEPKLPKAPNDYTVAINFTGGGMSGPYAVAIDASGDAWIANAAFFGGSGSGGIVEISPYGAFLSGVLGFSNAAIVYPDGLAVDSVGNIWIASNSGSFYNEISDLGALLAGPHGYSSPGSSTAVAIDGSGNAWFAGAAIREYSSSGANVAANPYSGGGLTTNSAIAIDGAGSAWIPNPTSTVTKLSSTGTLLSGASGFAASACCGSANAIAIDGSGNAWITTKPGVVEVSNSLGVLSGANGFTGGGLAAPTGIAIDGAGKVWVANTTGGADIAELSSSGTVLSGANGYVNANLSNPAGLAIDGSGDIWVANEGVQNSTSGNVLEFIGAATPVITPIAAGLPSAPTANGTSNLGTRP